MLSYTSQAEKDLDKQLLKKACRALRVTQHALCLNDCELWCLQGKAGRVTTWGDGTGCLLNIYDPTIPPIEQPARRWSAAKRRLTPFMKVAQNAEWGGVFRFELPVTTECAAYVRKYAKLRQRYSDATLAERSERARRNFSAVPEAASAARTAEGPPGKATRPEPARGCG